MHGSREPWQGRKDACFMERKYKYFMLCRDLAKTTPFLRADGSPVVTTAVNEREAWNKLKGLLEARLVTQD